MSLTFEGLQLGYGGAPLFGDISLDSISPGDLVAVIGPNGVGKSTLMKALAGLLKYSGRICFEQQELSGLTNREQMQTVGYLPQTLPQPTTLVAYELVFSACRATWGGLPTGEIEQRIETVFTQLGINGLALRKMQELSGGQRQMVGLAQVLVRQAPLLLLDEPTSALDLHWQLSVLQAVRDETLLRQSVALVASHDLNLTLRFCDYLLILLPDGTTRFGTPRDVLTPDYLRQAYQVEGRIERCSRGHTLVLADRPCE